MYTSLRLDFPPAPALVLGAFQRPSEVPERPITLRRPSGGGVVRVGPGTLWLQLELGLEGLPADKLVNRHVRPLLKALTKLTSQPVSYFGRDWISMAHRPVGFVGFAHDTSTGNGLFEAVLAIDEPLSPRPSFLGKEPATLGVTRDRLVDAVVEAYELAPIGEPQTSEAIDEPPWQATVDEAIGLVAAGRDSSGRLRIGGEFMASADAVTRLESALEASDVDLDHAIDEAFTTRGATIFGVRSLRSLRDVIHAARR